MNQTSNLVIVSLLPALGIIIGSLLAESMRTPRWLIGAALHATAGVAIALVSIDLMPRILPDTPSWLIVCCFLAGASLSILIAHLWGWTWHRSRFRHTGALMVYMAVLTDLITDGLMVGTGTAVGTQLGLLLAATQSLANIPGGFAATSNFRDSGMPRRTRIILAVSMILPALLSATLGFFLMRGLGPEAQGAVLSIFVGILLLATIEDVVPQGDEPNPPRWISSLAFAAGFALLALLSSIVT